VRTAYRLSLAAAAGALATAGLAGPSVALAAPAIITESVRTHRKVATPLPADSARPGAAPNT
jgi:hypothetical protein